MTTLNPVVVFGCSRVCQQTDEVNPTVSNVVPPADVLVEELHGPHVPGTLLEGQTGLAGLICVVDVEEGEGQGEWDGRGLVRLGAPLTPRDDRWAVWRGSRNDRKDHTISCHL